MAAGPTITSRSALRPRGRTQTGSSGVIAARAGLRSQASSDALRSAKMTTSRSRSVEPIPSANLATWSCGARATRSSAWSRNMTTRPPRAATSRSTAVAIVVPPSMIEAASIFGSAFSSSSATRPIGSAPGSITGSRIVPGCNRRRGSTAARTSDDLPLPDGPTTRTERAAGWASRSRTCARSASRPKSTAASDSVSRRKPGYGLWSGSQENWSPGAWPVWARPATSRSTRAAGSSIGPIAWRSRRSGWLATFRLDTWTTNLPRATAYASSVWHQADASELGLARKTTMSARSTAANSSDSHRAPGGMPCSGSLSRNTAP